MAVSDRVKSGPEKAPHRSLWKALGLTDEELKLPLIGVVSAKSECVPGHNHLNNIAQAVKDGIRLAGGVPVEFPAIGVCDGIAMGHVGMKYSLASRELIADSCESMAIAHGFDGMVFIPNCDKIVPGMLMAARRLNLPAMVISGGPMMPGRMPGGSGDMDLNSVFEAVGAYKAGKMDDTQLNAVESAACPGCGSCSGMFTANSMNCITEVIGMALPGNGTIAAVDAARIRLAKKTGMRVVELVREGLTPEKIMTESAFRNALCLDMALGCSTNTVLHLPAIAHEAGIDFDLNWVNEASAKVPNLCHLAPAGHHHVIDLHLAGGVMGVLSELKGRGLLDVFQQRRFFLDGGVLPPFEILAPLLHAARLLADVGAAAHGVGLARYFRRVRADLRVLDLVGPRARLPRGLLQTADLLFQLRVLRQLKRVLPLPVFIP